MLVACLIANGFGSRNSVSLSRVAGWLPKKNFRIEVDMRVEVICALMAVVTATNVAIVTKNRKPKEVQMKFSTRYTPPPSPSFRTVGSSRTRQEFKAECDINCILAKMGAGLLAPCAAPEPVYADFDSAPRTYEECMAVILDANARFAALPSRVRDRFGNKPQNMLDFLADESNKDEAIKLGLINAPAPVPEKKDEPNS